MPDATIARIISGYDSHIIKAYCWGRFKILHQQFLEEIGQYLPEQGRVLDMGCGFGLFSLYYAARCPGLLITGIDVNEARIQIATMAAAALCLENVRYEVGDVSTYDGGRALDGAYMLDIVHHVPPAAVRPLVRKLYSLLSPGARLLIKDVKADPVCKRWFTYLLDKLVDLKAPLHYWHEAELLHLLSAEGFETFRHTMVDILPYPHILYVCQKRQL